MTKTYQTVELQDNTWDVFCLETGESVTPSKRLRADRKSQAVRMVAALNACRFPLQKEG